MSNLPSGWKNLKLGQFMEFKNGLNFTKTDSGDEIKIVGVSDFKDFSELRSTENLDIVNVSNKLNENYLLKNGDLLFVRSNGNKNLIGRCLYFPNVTERVSYSGFTIRGRVDDSVALPLYISSFARSSVMKQQIRRNGGGTNISNLNQQILNDITLKLPPLAEQQKIADILSTWDTAINTTEQMLANSQQQKKSLMQQLLTGKKRLLDDNGEVFCGDWKAKKAGDLLTESKVLSKDNNPNKRLTVRLSLKGIEKRGVRGTEAVNSTSFFVRRSGQFIYGKQNIHKGSFGIIPDEFDCFETTQDLPSFDFSETGDPYWFLHFVSHKQFYSQLETRMTGTGSKRLNPKEFLKMEIELPPLAEQQAIAKVLTSADQQIDSLKQQIAKLKDEKKALMQVLLSGKVRVK